MVIQHNLSAINANRQLGIVSQNNASSTEKLSSGYQINRSADDAAGLAISEKMRKEIRGLNRASHNVEEGISYVQVADGALNEVHDMLQRINELAVQSANGTNSESDRQSIDDEVQQLKTEMERIFETTAFNEKKIWDGGEPRVVKKIINTIQVQSLTLTTPTYQRMTVNNDNYDKISCNGYTVHASETDGVYVSWMGYNGIDYRTRNISWSELKDIGNSFDIDDYFETDSTKIGYSADLFDASGNPIDMNYTISFSVVDGATNAQKAAALDTVVYSSSAYSSMVGTLSTKNSYVYWGDEYINYAAMYASRKNANTATGETGNDFNVGNTNFLEADTTANASGGNFTQIPENNTSNFSTANNSTQTWKLKFQMEGIGEVVAESNSISYYSTDSTADDEGYWWRYGTTPSTAHIKYTYSRSSSAHGSGSLGSVMDTLTDPKALYSSGGTPGLVDGSDTGGYITLGFSLESTSSYTYGNSLQSSNIGSFSLTIHVTSSDTKQDVLDHINDALKNVSVIDFSASANNSYQSFNYTSYPPKEKESLMDVDEIESHTIYDDIELSIHSGAEDTDKIPIKYTCLRLSTLGMQDSNVLTQEAALRAIDEVSEALTIVSAQRSLFGAYQNRMEHAYKIDTNTSENTQAAESQIRDTDMAKEMVAFSNTNILEQAGQSMLAQSNQANQGILSLLR